jgi:hypothetical protein
MQKEIVEIIAAIDGVVVQSQRTLATVQKLRSGLLSDLLSGEHEIPASYDTVKGATS